MGINIEFNLSAFKHGMTINDKSINVFHAMKCQNIYFHLLDT